MIRREIRLARLDKIRPALVLTRAAVGFTRDVTVAAITSTIHGITTELPVGANNGLDHDSVVNLNDIQTIRRADLGRLIGYLHPDQEPALHEALIRAFDLHEDWNT